MEKMTVGGETLQLTLKTGMLGQVSQIIFLYIYFAQLRHHHENTDKCFCTMDYIGEKILIPYFLKVTIVMNMKTTKGRRKNMRERDNFRKD